MTSSATMLGWAIVIAVALVGAVNVAVVAFPVELGNATWEVAAFGELASSFAVPTLGAALLGFMAVQRGVSAAVLFAALWSLVLGAVASLGIALLVLDIPVVLHATRGGALVQTQLRVLVGKSIVFSGLYAAALLFLTGYFTYAFVRLRRMR